MEATQQFMTSTTNNSDGPIRKLTLYVGDLDVNVNEHLLYFVFSQIAPIASIRLCRDIIQNSSLSYAYVNFFTPQDAALAKERLNFTRINGKVIRIMYSNRDPYLRKIGHANVFIKNLDSSIDNKALYNRFATFGTILSCKVALNENGHSKGYGFVQFDQENEANDAINSLNGMVLKEKEIYVGPFIRREKRYGVNGTSKFTNVYVKNLPESFTDEDIKRIFDCYGSITSAVVMKDSNEKSKCFGFVNFESDEDAAKAIEKLNGTIQNDKVLYVGRAQKKAEREAELKAKFQQKRISHYEKSQAANLYLKNLDTRINEEKLEELFSQFGTITSCKVMVNPQGVSKGYGFVAFSTPEEANRALNEMNGKMIANKPIYVAIAQRKQERKAKLQAQFSEARLQGEVRQLPIGMHGLYTGAHRAAPPQLFYGQGAPGMLPPHHARNGDQQHPFIPRIRPGATPNFMMPYPFQRGGQIGLHLGNGHQLQLQQQHSGAQNSQYMSNAGNGHDPSVLHQGQVRPMTPMPSTSVGVARSAPHSVSALASAQPVASPNTQSMMLGDQLYPLVEQIAPENARKITGMLLEMDQKEVLHLIEFPDSLRMKVDEALRVLRSATLNPEVCDHSSSLSHTE
ncbi:unnamed protein product [Amaranthus hypochondriacus]